MLSLFATLTYNCRKMFAVTCAATKKRRKLEIHIWTQGLCCCCKGAKQWSKSKGFVGWHSGFYQNSFIWKTVLCRNGTFTQSLAEAGLRNSFFPGNGMSGKEKGSSLRVEVGIRGDQTVQLLWGWEPLHERGWRLQSAWIWGLGMQGDLSEEPAPRPSRSKHVAFRGFDPLSSKAQSTGTSHNLWLKTQKKRNVHKYEKTDH